MKASPAARSWIAAGVRYELLTRVLPALRHDMVGPVSVMRMGVLMLKRQVEAPTIDSQACNERVALIDAQVAELLDGVRLLRNWELSGTDEGIARSELVQMCVALLRPAFSLQGIQLEMDATLEEPTADTEERLPRASALRYLLLCGLNFIHDACTDECIIRIEPEGEHGLVLHTVPSLDGGVHDGMPESTVVHCAPRRLAIDAVALQNLADDLGYEVHADSEASVRVSLIERQEKA
ncbi:MAG: hypothetical protein JSS14_04365 [Proteobacteria bacterium]|nr:hypothetical protein [Pseudomonadota bacterium]